MNNNLAHHSYPRGYQAEIWSGETVTTELLQQVADTRDQAWRKDGVFKQDKNDWLDAIDSHPDTTHIILKHEDQVVGAVRVTVHRDVESLQDGVYYLPYQSNLTAPLAQITRIVVSPEHEGLGIGTKLMQQAIRIGEYSDANAVVCDVDAEVKPEWLKKFGYEVIGETGQQEGYQEDKNWIIVCKTVQDSAIDPSLLNRSGVQFSTPICQILAVDNQNSPGVIPSFQGYDLTVPFFRWISSSKEICINDNRKAYTTVAGKTFPGPDNVGFEIQKKSLRTGKEFTQRIGVLANHGEAESWIRWNFVQGFFGSDAPLSIYHIDGHGDEMRSRNARMRESHAEAKGKTFFELAKLNSETCGISSFLASLVEHGIIDPTRWYFKSIVDSWSSSGFWYQEKPRFVGSQASTTSMQFDLEPEHGVLADGLIYEQSADVTDIDMDYLYYVENPIDIAHAIMKAVKTASDSPLVNIVTSPGWLDQELAVVYAKLHVELLQSRPDPQLISDYVDQLYDHLEELAVENQSQKVMNAQGSNHLYSGALRNSEEQRAEMKNIFTLPLSSSEFDFNNREVNPDETEVSFYYKSLGKLSDRLIRSKITAETEVSKYLLPAFENSPYVNIQKLVEDFRYDPATTEEQILERACELANIPGEEHMSRYFQQQAPVDYALAKITYHLMHSGLANEYEVRGDLRLLLGIIKAGDITEHPVTIKHSVLGFFHVFGLESDLFDYRFGDPSQHLAETENWRSRISADLQGISSDHNFKDKLEQSIQSGRFTAVDAVNALEIDGGGTVTMQLVRESEVLNYPFTFRSGQQAAPELYAYTLVNGYVWLDKDKKVAIPNAENVEQLTRWDVLERDLEGAKRKTVMEDSLSSWQLTDSKQTADAIILSRRVRKFHDALILAKVEAKDEQGQSIIEFLEIAENLYWSLKKWEPSAIEEDYNSLILALHSFDTKHMLSPKVLALKKFIEQSHSLESILEETAVAIRFAEYQTGLMNSYASGLQDVDMWTFIEKEIVKELPLSNEAFSEKIDGLFFTRDGTARKQFGVFNIDTTRLDGPDRNWYTMYTHLKSKGSNMLGGKEKQTEVVRTMAHIKRAQVAEETHTLKNGYEGPWHEARREEVQAQRTAQLRDALQEEIHTLRTEHKECVNQLEADLRQLKKQEYYFVRSGLSRKSEIVDSLMHSIWLHDRGEGPGLEEHLEKYPIDGYKEFWLRQRIPHWCDAAGIRPYDELTHPFPELANEKEHLQRQLHRIKSKYLEADDYFGSDPVFLDLANSDGIVHFVKSKLITIPTY